MSKYQVQWCVNSLTSQRMVSNGAIITGHWTHVFYVMTWLSNISGESFVPPLGFTYAVIKGLKYITFNGAWKELLWYCVGCSVLCSCYPPLQALSFLTTSAVWTEDAVHDTLSIPCPQRFMVTFLPLISLYKVVLLS